MRSRYLIWILILPVIFGFRAAPQGNNWSISKSDPTLWIKVCSVPTFDKTDFPAGDPLAGTNPDFIDSCINNDIHRSKKLMGAC